MALTDRVRALVEPPLTGQGFELVDVEMAGATLRVLVDREGGIDLEAVAEATQRDKKRRGGAVGFVLVDAPGQVRTGCAVAPDELRAALRELQR